MAVFELTWAEIPESLSPVWVIINSFLLTYFELRMRLNLEKSLEHFADH